MNEVLLIQQLQQGDQAAFKQLVDACQNRVYNTVLGIVQQPEDAEDVSQEVFVQVYQNVKDFRGDSALTTWLYRIAVTKALDWERRKKAKKRISLVKNLIGLGAKEEDTIPDFHHPGVAMDNKEQASILFKAMRQLPDNQRTAFTLIKVEGLSYDEVSNIMQVTVKALEALMHRAKENLRKQLKNYYSSL